MDKHKEEVMRKSMSAAFRMLREDSYEVNSVAVPKIVRLMLSIRNFVHLYDVYSTENTSFTRGIRVLHPILRSFVNVTVCMNEFMNLLHTSLVHINQYSNESDIRIEEGGYGAELLSLIASKRSELERCVKELEGAILAQGGTIERSLEEASGLTLIRGTEIDSEPEETEEGDDDESD